MILTTARIVCVNKDIKSLFHSFDLPLALISSEKFEQPIFGSNYIQAICKPLMNLLPGEIKFKIWFTSGGCGTFIPAFFNVLTNVRKNGNKGPDSKLINQISSGVFAKSCYMDPNDPSKIYLEQPSVQVSYI
jgi:WW domain-binding protein 2